MKINGLEQLHLASNQINCDGIESLFGNSSLQKLNLALNEINDADLKNFQIGNLVKLSLSCNKISDEGAIKIAQELAYNSTLNKLSLSNNEIRDEGASALATELAKNSTLTDLSLAHNNIGESGINKLTSITKLKINLEENRVKPQILPSSAIEPTSFSQSSQYFNEK
jgi:hypothetical protein